LEIRPEVETDLAAAALWYEMQQPGLGVRFLDEVETAWHRLEQNPLLSAVKPMGQGIRWCYPDHFPYRIVYHADEKKTYGANFGGSSRRPSGFGNIQALQTHFHLNLSPSTKQA
jgi:hypothetical protein